MKSDLYEITWDFMVRFLMTFTHSFWRAKSFTVDFPKEREVALLAVTSQFTNLSRIFFQ